MDILYENLTKHFEKNEIRELFAQANLPELRTIDLNMGQVNNPEGFEIFYPAMFIDWSDKADGQTEPLSLELVFHILQIPSFATENFSDNLHEGLDYLRFLKTIKKALNSFRTPNASKFKYLGTSPNITPFYKYHTLNYSCYIDDTTSEPELTAVELQGYNMDFGIKEKCVDLPTSIETL